MNIATIEERIEWEIRRLETKKAYLNKEIDGEIAGLRVAQSISGEYFKDQEKNLAQAVKEPK